MSISTSATASRISCSAHFPNIYEKLLGLGIDITREPIPVVPAQHYTCGGVVVDLDGRTDAPGLYAAGEVTQSGLHGANRLASNSLLECLVFGEAAARHIAANWEQLPHVPAIRAWDESRVTDSDEEVVIAQNWGEIRRFMWNYVGIVRTTKRLERAKHRIDMLRQRSERILRPLPGHARPDRAAQPGRGRRPHHPQRAQPRTKAAGCTTRSIIPTCCRRRRTRCWFRERPHIAV